MVLVSGKQELLSQVISLGVCGSAWLRFKEMQSVASLSGMTSISRPDNGSHKLNADGIHTVLKPRWRMGRIP
jgi:hypothetical protein